MQEYSIYRDNARDEGEKMKVIYKYLRDCEYTNLNQIKADIKYLKIMVADGRKGFKYDLKIARRARKEFKKL